MKSVVINLAIAPEEYQRWYQGAVQNVLAYTVDGRSVRFPAPILRRFITHDGIRGRFKITFDDQNRFQSIDRID